jgi:trans-aconitate methyltransferase
MPVVDLLAPRAGERILDLGCGDGALTEKIVQMGCDVLGVDSSPQQVEAAKKRGLHALVLDAGALNFTEEFDAAFSNAALHWMRQPDAVIAGVHRALKAKGRFVGECGGDGCIQTIRLALVEALDRRGIDGESRVPWYFPSPGDYATRLESAGFRVHSIALFPRPTPLPGDVVEWLETFGEPFTSALPVAARTDYLQEVRSVLEPKLRDTAGTWVADYVRLRFLATKGVGSPRRSI